MCRLLAITVPEEHQGELNDAIIPAALTALTATSLRLLSYDGTKGNLDGTGVAQVKNNDISGYKSSYPAVKHTLKTDYKDWMSTVDWKLPLLGHVRLASVAKAKANELLPHKHAQPFSSDNCVLMHNGTIKNWKEVAENNEIKGFDAWTDSWVLTQLLNKSEWTPDLWKDVVAQLDGSYALIGAHIKDDKALWITRYKRPLYLYEIDKGKMQIVCTSRALDIALMEVAETIYAITKEDVWRDWESIELDEEQLFRLNTEGKGSLDCIADLPATKWPTTYTTQVYNWGREFTARSDFPGFEIVDALKDVIGLYDFSANDLRIVWESREGVIKGSMWNPEAAQQVSDFIKWCIEDNERLNVLATTLGRNIYNKEAV